MLSQPAFLDIDIERGIVLEEILEDLDDEGHQVDADNISRALIYGDHPLGFTITGGRSTSAASTKRCCGATTRSTTPRDNAVLAFSGNIDERRALQIAERDFGALPRGERVAAAPPDHSQQSARLDIVDNVSSQTELRVCFRALSEVDPLRPALDVLMRVIDDGMSTRLYHRLCDARGLCYDVSAGYDGYEDDGVVDVAAGVQHKRVALVAREVLAMFEELALDGPTAEELEKVRRGVAWDMRADGRFRRGRGGFLRERGLFDRPSTPERHVAELVAHRRDQVREAARAIARPDRLDVVAVGLLEDGEDERLAEVVEGWTGPR